MINILLSMILIFMVAFFLLALIDVTFGSREWFQRLFMISSYYHDKERKRRQELGYNR